MGAECTEEDPINARTGHSEGELLSESPVPPTQGIHKGAGTSPSKELTRTVEYYTFIHAMGGSLRVFLMVQIMVIIRSKLL